MDNRHRVYYLASLHQNHYLGWWIRGYDDFGFRYEANLKKLKQSVPSLKIRPCGFTDRYGTFWQMKLSCKREEETLLYNTLTSLTDVDWSMLDWDGEQYMTHVCRRTSNK